MREFTTSIESWRRDGRQIALATVVKAWGSAPRPLGAQMVITDRGQMAGSVSGGCVEGAVVEAAQEVLEERRGRLESYGISQDDAFAIGLSCGGTLEVYIEPFDEAVSERLADAVTHHRLVALATVIGGAHAGRQWVIEPSHTDGSDGDRDDPADDALERAARDAAAELWLSHGATRRSVEIDAGTHDLFVQVVAPPPRLVIVGAVHVAVALVSMAKTIGFETIVIDPRTAFATEERFAHADRLMHDWPDAALRSLELDANSFVALLSHDLKLDIPALEIALPRARYVGALGSRKTQAKRLEALAEAGIDDALAARIHNPIGLDLGGRRAEEIAVAVLAQIVAVSHGKDAREIPPAELPVSRAELR